ncbi:RNA polymerase subunit sigma-24 [Serinibacter arcticus]|uniref:RNA polymerase subunit sigma-24 n=1 Tax=Serinibacter arcticus TaxID=1655435 RepID=A0A2U1ZUV2_9MICO|nr:sigma-70 family RNA polymerase sigma factor [Serinibacter arcticus]PWD50702.1 RNA polymerase subunit sigma-24 [Serinibacter arcticus]
MNGWDEAVEAVARTRGDRLLRTAYLLCGDVDGAKDLVQDALIRTMGSSRRRRGAGSAAPSLPEAEAYVRRAITSQFLDDRRSATRWRSVEHLVVQPESDGAGEARRTDTRLDVVAALASLPPRPRTCLVLRFYADLTVPQIAAELELAEGSVKRYLHDGVTALGARLAPVTSEEA